MEKRQLLGESMHRARMSQSTLAALSGVHQPSISQMLSGRIEPSDEMLERLLACMGYRLEITRQATPVDLERTTLRRWRMHQRIASQLTPERWAVWRPRIDENIKALKARIRGEPHRRNIGRWEMAISTDDLASVRRISNGLDPDSIAMREVSPLGGLLSSTERLAVLQEVRRWTAPS